VDFSKGVWERSEQGNGNGEATYSTQRKGERKGGSFYVFMPLLSAQSYILQVVLPWLMLACKEIGLPLFKGHYPPSPERKDRGLVDRCIKEDKESLPEGIGH
jgi:hypothetical protein